MMTDRAKDFHAALWTDLRRNRTDADLTDVKFLATEAEHALSHLRQWMKPLSVSTPPVLGPAHVPTYRRDCRRECRRRQAFGGGPGHR
jgi:aldehyde dehydrogenase (NAD+)